LVHAPHMAVVHILLLLLRTLTVGRVSHGIIAVGLHLLRRRTWGIDGLDTLRRGGDNVVLSLRLIQVIGAGGEEEQCAAQPDFLRKRRQAAHTNPVGRRHYHVAWALWAIPVTTGIKVILSTPANARMAAGHTVNLIARTVLRAWAPTVAMPIGPALPVVIARSTVATTGTRRVAALPVLILV